MISNLIINNDEINFELNNNLNQIQISLANAIRRTIIYDIYTYAINNNSVIFFENNSMLNNEFLKHRLSLIPIISDRIDINYEDVLISLKKKNEEEEIISIYVNDFKCIEKTTNSVIDNNLLFKYPNILFAKLKHNQQLSFNAELIKNNSEKGGSFFSPVSKCIYTFKIDDKKSQEIMKEMSKDEKISFLKQDIERHYEIKKNGLPSTYIFSIESIGFYEPKTVILLGIESLIEKLSMIHLEFNNKKSKKVIIKYDEENEDFFNFLIDEENETIGNLLSTYITYNDNVFFSGYLIEHPLKKNIILKVKLNKDNTIDNVISTITINIDKIINILKNIIIELQ